MLPIQRSLPLGRVSLSITCSHSSLAKSLTSHCPLSQRAIFWDVNQKNLQSHFADYYPRRWFHSGNSSESKSAGNKAGGKPDWYTVLGVEKTASQSDIKKAYYQLAKKWHPDQADNKQNPTARKKFNEVAEAYATLSDPKRKEIYDKYGHSEQADMAHFDPEEMFAELFGNFDPFEPGANQQNKNNQTGANIDIPVKLTFHEAAHGTTKTITYSSQMKCNSCEGSGAAPSGMVLPCNTCESQGYVIDGVGMFARPKTCTDCEGYGSIVTHPCSACHGVGTVKKKRSLKVKIPPAVDSAHQVRLKGKGDIGPRNSGKNGTLFLGVTVEEDDRIRRDDLDLHVDVPLTISQAVLGDSAVRIKTLSSEIEVKVPSGIQPGEKRVLRGRGLKRGHQRDRQKELIKEFGEGERIRPYAGSFIDRARKKLGF